MSDEHIKEASWVANSVTGASAYLHGVDYNQDEFRQELGKAIEYIKKQRGQEAA